MPQGQAPRYAEEQACAETRDDLPAPAAMSGYSGSDVQPAEAEPAKKAQDVSQHVNMRIAGSQQRQQANPGNQRRPAIPETLALTELLSPGHSREQPERRKYGRRRAQRSMCDRCDQCFRQIRQRSGAEDARPGNTRPKQSTCSDSRHRSKQHIAQQMLLVHVQCQRRRGSPPFAPRTAIERSRRQPIDAEHRVAGTISRQQENQHVQEDSDCRSRMRLDRLEDAAWNRAFGGIAADLIIRLADGAGSRAPPAPKRPSARASRRTRYQAGFQHQAVFVAEPFRAAKYHRRSRSGFRTFGSIGSIGSIGG